MWLTLYRTVYKMYIFIVFKYKHSKRWRSLALVKIGRVMKLINGKQRKLSVVFVKLFSITASIDVHF